jgi:hypothetical protein
MAAITGAASKIGVAITATYNTAQAMGAGDKWEVDSMTMDENAETLRLNPIGSGQELQTEAERGAISPTVTVPFVEQYEGPSLELEALLFGATSAAPMLMGAGAYSHSVLYNATRPSFWASVARQITSDKAQEMPSGLPTRLSVRCENPPNYVMCDTEIIGDQIREGSVNTFAVVDTVTLEDAKRVVVKPTDKFRINGQAGDALDDDDELDITSIDIAYERPLEHVREIRNASSTVNGQPRSSGNPPFSATMTVTFRNCSDAAYAYFAAQVAGTEYKADLHVVGDQIGSTGIYYSIIRSFPRLKILSFPQHPLSQPGDNPLTVVFEALTASANPTGMISTLPYSIWQNTRSTSPLEVG